MNKSDIELFQYFLDGLNLFKVKTPNRTLNNVFLIKKGLIGYYMIYYIVFIDYDKKDYIINTYPTKKISKIEKQDYILI